MTEFELSESAEEVLAGLWVSKTEQEEPSRRGCELAITDREAALVQLRDFSLIHEHDGTISLTPSGEIEAASIIRRERLAERLLTDVLAVGDEQATEAACRFEHLLRKGIDDQVCTLLGHPKACPHGSPIPPGDCCRDRSRSAGTVISSLAELAAGQAGVIAYLHGTRREMIQRMLAMGVAPGARITLLQTAPSYVLQVGQTQLAVDRETAEDIYVRIAGRRREAHRHRWLSSPLRKLGRQRRGR